MPSAEQTAARDPVGWIVGGALALVVLTIALLVAVVPFVSAGFDGFRPHHTASSTAEQVLDGVTVRYSGEGWTFVLDSPQDCPAAKVVVGFADRAGGESIDVLTDTAPLVAGIPYRYAPAPGSSEHPFAHIDEIVCHAM
ncbi:hypothetical protein IT072_01990 [Leifsonia sp. ZF2019]|uniref:hypothetical protein n=1 Tax=Leifsonia sp. ZF2019 TaxID=2781978 RepID=UPI001CBC766C|nr:hypothetical protein [Leifsonia sp. ZF2019]UAJ79873.1 hypothetical protein IT072_01990 [Leifsonia sp. ZF2019]